MEMCFVIQPSNGEKNDERYHDIYKPAIEACELEAYRAVNDPSVGKPIDHSVLKIRNSRIVIAEITTDSPNVWFELGYAIACKKDIVIVCSDEHKKQYSYDIQHRKIHKYEADSRSAYDKLRKSIVNDIEAFLKTAVTLPVIEPSVLKHDEKLSDSEIIALSAIIEACFTDETIDIERVKVNMNHGKDFNELGVGSAIRKLFQRE